MRRRLGVGRNFADCLCACPRLSLFIFDLAVLAIFAWRSQHYYAAALPSMSYRLLYFSLTLCAWLMTLTIFGFYDLRRWGGALTSRSVIRQLVKALLGGIILTLLVLLILLSPAAINLSRKVITAFLIIALAAVSRFGWRHLLRYCRGRQVAIVVVKERSAKAPVRRLIDTYCSDYYVSAVLALEDLGSNNFLRPGADSASRGETLQIIHSLKDKGAESRLENLLARRRSGLILTPLADILEQATGKVSGLPEVGKLPPLPPPCANSRYEIAKKVTDLVLAGLGLVIFLPLLLLLAALIKLDSPGPVFYRQRRVGRADKTFRLIKLRSMPPDAERATGAVWAKQTDPRSTRVGKWLRRLHLDEIPQLFNVLKGEMSLVGPRPERPEMIPALTPALPAYPLRHQVLPGVTGWAQINRPADSNCEDVASKLAYDLYYLKYRNLLLDIRIILRTLDIALFGVGEELWLLAHPEPALPTPVAVGSRSEPESREQAVFPEIGYLPREASLSLYYREERNMSVSAGMPAGK
jgi:exopolysaccharide biosynthesis polyprenyl glycosylphosphotransferase